MEDAVYLENFQTQIERLLTLMDRKETSETYGCLCRPYWHDKTMDFPSAHQQIGVLPLAIVYTQELEQNPYHGSEEIGGLCKAGMRYWANIQKRNGSFDEHYPNEHSLGATAWSLWAVSESYLMLEDPPRIEDAFRKAASFIQSYSEPGELANHRAVAANALLNASKIVEIETSEIEQKISEVEKMQSEEGWFKEYNGADIGYQSTTISHLAQIWQKDRSLVEREVIASALDFFSNFIDGENYYGRGLGSRHTQHVHPTGFEILAEEFEQAKRIAAALRQNLDSGKLLEPRQMDDKHFSRLQAENLLASMKAGELESEPPTIERRDYQDILIRRPEGLVYIDRSRGGHFRLYQDGELEAEDRGVTRSIEGEYYTSDWPGSTESVEENEGGLRIEGNLYKLPENRLAGWRFLAARLFQRTLGRSPKISLKMKNVLIESIIRGQISDYSFVREINLKSGEVDSSSPGEKVEGSSGSNFVPSSEFYFTSR